MPTGSKERVEKKCLTCGSSFSVVPSSKKKWCTRLCFNSTRIKVKLQCQECGVIFGVTPAFKNQKYCSSKCLRAKKSFRVSIECVTCKTSFLERPCFSWVKYCSKICRSVGRSESAKGGEQRDRYYLRVPITQRLSSVSETRQHRFNMELAIGRPLFKKEMVHHADGDRKNNDIGNLILLRGSGAHTRLHRFAKRHGIPIGTLRFDQPWLIINSVKL